MVSAALARLPGALHPGTTHVHSDTPDHDAVHHYMPAAFRKLMMTAQCELLLTNAYIIPGDRAIQRFHDLHARGVKLRILTNSLASHDVPAVNSHYKQWRRPILETGTELYEIQPDAAVRSVVADTPQVADFIAGARVARRQRKTRTEAAVQAVHILSQGTAIRRSRHSDDRCDAARGFGVAHDELEHVGQAL